MKIKFIAKSIIFITLVLAQSTSFSQDLYPIPDGRKDTVKLDHVHLKMDMRSIGNSTLNSMAELTLISKINALQTLRLDLERLTVDSIYCDLIKCNYNYNFQRINVNLPAGINTNDTFKLKVYYQGTPRKDPSGFGGFYFTSDYAFAIGVGFQAEPHPFGRSWFPCFDNFVMKSTYSYDITTDTGYAAVCGGALESKAVNGAEIQWKFKLNQPIPSYLASLSVSRYELLQGQMNTLQGDIPYILAAQAKDTQNLSASFSNFKGAVNAFIHYYGDYYWDRLGYHCVPFNGGAMEHACNISYPLFAIDGTTNREDLMAHELAHHWWGNNITCKTQEDMWINEGWASYSEKLFNEYVYGKARYRQKVEETHRNVLQFAHIADGEILPVSGVGHDNTYGRHVYRKGADIAHSLRFYMGDTGFFKAIKHIMSTQKFGNMDSKQLMDSFQQFTNHDLSHFYKGWVIGKGFPHLAVKTWETKESNGAFNTSVGILQRNRWDGTPHSEIPIEINFLKSDFTWESKRVLATPYQSNFNFNLPFKPLWVGVDIDAKLSDATTDTFRSISSTGLYNFEDGLMNIDVTKVGTPSFVHITHNWIAADASTQMGTLPVLSKDRYWTVSGVWGDDFEATATLQYNGRTNQTSGDFFLDNQLIKGTEDSLTLMYRPDMFSPWVLADATKDMGPSKFDREGTFTITNLKAGEYTLAMYSQALASNTLNSNNSRMQIYPNPVKDIVHLDFVSFNHPGYILITDSTGKIILKKAIRNTQNNLDINTKEWPAGTYAIVLQYPDGQSSKASFVVTK